MGDEDLLQKLVVAIIDDVKKISQQVAVLRDRQDKNEVLAKNLGKFLDRLAVLETKIEALSKKEAGTTEFQKTSKGKKWGWLTAIITALGGAIAVIVEAAKL